MRKLKADEIECRVAQVSAKGCSLLLYKTARVDRAILNEVYGDLWQNDFKVINGNMYGGIGIYNKELKEWLWRWDCGTESLTEKEKGQASDCFKRAGFKWGIGVELYTAPFIFIKCETKQDGTKYKLVNPYVKYSVKNIGYSENGDIKELTIIDNNNVVVYKLGQKIEPKPQPQAKPTKDDTDIYIGLEAIDTTANALKYYRQYKDLVNDEKAFTDAYKKKYSQLKVKEKNENDG